MNIIKYLNKYKVVRIIRGLDMRGLDMRETAVVVYYNSHDWCRQLVNSNGLVLRSYSQSAVVALYNYCCFNSERLKHCCNESNMNSYNK